MSLAVRLSRLETSRGIADARSNPRREGAAPPPAETILDSPEVVAAATRLWNWRRDYPNEPIPAHLSADVALLMAHREGRP